MTPYDPKPISCEQARAIDRKASELLGIPGLLLMENAARNAAVIACDMLTTFDSPALQSASHSSPAEVMILAGGGNNAGDGYAVARHLMLAGHTATIFALREPDELIGDAAINAHIAQKLGITIHLLPDLAAVQVHARSWEGCDLLIDAMLGTGFTGDVRPVMAGAIERCNHAHEQGVSVLALDVPSGLNADTGKPANIAIHADVTATFVAMKKGFLHEGAQRYTGKVRVCDIGVPTAALL